MNPAAIREEQATACLEAASIYKDLLLALATKLTGNAEDGMDLFQQVSLNCHDAIRRTGFEGDKYHFYLRAAMHNHFKRSKQRGGREISYDFQGVMTYSQTRHDEGDAPWAAKTGELGRNIAAATSLGVGLESHDAHAYLAEQVMSEVRAAFGDGDRVALRLHIDGYSTREIAILTGKPEHTTVWRRLEKMKDYLREKFQQAWDSLEE
jgi:DNA-directed RNA polymerase specialized sigma24 family protein